MDVWKENARLIREHGISASQNLSCLKEFLSEVRSRASFYDIYNVTAVDLAYSVCQGDLLVFLNLKDSSENYRRLFRRRLGLNGMETMIGLYKYSVSEETIVLFFHL